MDVSDGEIECLDEDADIVQQCMMYARGAVNSVEENQLLQEVRKRKPASYQEDQDYDPELSRVRRKVLPAKPLTRTVQRKPSIVPNNFIRRKKLPIKIPDYDDPLCLPVKAMVKDSFDSSRLKTWNNQCIDQMRLESAAYQTKKSETVSSTRTIVLKCIKNQLTEKMETSLRFKLTTHDKQSKSMSEMFQGILPNYREKKRLNYWLTEQRVHKKQPSTISTVILSKDSNKDEETLEVYKPQEALTAIYNLVNDYDEEDPSNQTVQRHLAEKAVVRSCALCHQQSKRQAKGDKQKDVYCAICKHHFVSVYNLLAHLKTHKGSDVARYSRIISRTLADIVEYHYKCRICNRVYETIKGLRDHIKTHAGKEPFLCEICNRIVK